MKTAKCIGIWMDHHLANITSLNPTIKSKSIVSDFTHKKKEEILKRTESGMHNKENQQQEHFYKEISKQILNYDKVILFGPTDAKIEFKHFLNKDSNFKKIKIDVVSTDKMTESEQHIFIKNHFNNFL